MNCFKCCIPGYGRQNYQPITQARSPASTSETTPLAHLDTVQSTQNAGQTQDLITVPISIDSKIANISLASINVAQEATVYDFLLAVIHETGSTKSVDELQAEIQTQNSRGETSTTPLYRGEKLPNIGDNQVIAVSINT